MEKVSQQKLGWHLTPGPGDLGKQPHDIRWSGRYDSVSRQTLASTAQRVGYNHLSFLWIVTSLLSICRSVSHIVFHSSLSICVLRALFSNIELPLSCL